MKPTWEVVKKESTFDITCKCNICNEEFLVFGRDHINMGLVKCEECGQFSWQPKCPNGCPSIWAENEEEN